MVFKHVPIMLNECIEGLNIKPDGIYVDATLGGGGHSSYITKKLNSKGLLIGIDKDIEAINASKERLKGDCKKIFVNSDYKDYSKILEDNNISGVDGILIDLGVSSYQIDNAERGFSYKNEGSLDMRMDQKQDFSAYNVVNEYSEKDLTEIFFKYGEEQFSRVIARNIVKERESKPIQTTTELCRIIEKSVPSKVLHKGTNPNKKVFQAIRIEVNKELIGLDTVLEQMISSLNRGGRMCVITFHSLEDRIVKNVFKLDSTDCICPKSLPICVCHHKASIQLISRKPILPSERELEENPRSSSSKLRIIEKL